MTVRSFIVWVLGATALAYTLSAQEILGKMTSHLSKADAVEARIARENPDGEILEDKLVTIPVKPDSGTISQEILDLPYFLMTLPLEDFLEIFPTVGEDSTTVSLGRLDGQVCYILNGADMRIWISKDKFIPLKLEIDNGRALGDLYLYLDMVQLSKKVLYPSRTEVWRDGELILIERLLPATASTQQP